MANDFQIELICDCVIARPLPGDTGLPMSAIQKMSRLLPKKGKGAVMDLDLGRIHDAIIVAGSPANLARLRQAPETMQRAQALAASLPYSLSDAARHWAIWGQHGRSSQAIFTALTGVILPPSADRVISHPLDAADMRRCLMVVDQVPEFAPRIAELGRLSPEWSGLAAAWEDIARAFEREAPEWRTGSGPLPRSLSDLVEAATAPKNEADLLP